MDNDFINKVNGAYRKGFSSNPQFAMAAKAIGELAMGNDEILKNENTRGRIESSREVKRHEESRNGLEEMER